MTHRSANAVITSVATTYDDNVLALRTDVFLILKLGVKQGLCVELHADCQLRYSLACA